MSSIAVCNREKVQLCNNKIWRSVIWVKTLTYKYFSHFGSSRHIKNSELSSHCSKETTWLRLRVQNARFVEQHRSSLIPPASFFIDPKIAATQKQAKWNGMERSMMYSFLNEDETRTGQWTQNEPQTSLISKKFWVALVKSPIFRFSLLPINCMSVLIERIKYIARCVKPMETILMVMYMWFYALSTKMLFWPVDLYTVVWPETVLISSNQYQFKCFGPPSDTIWNKIILYISSQPD